MAALSARLELMEKYMSLKFPAWREEIDAALGDGVRGERIGPTWTLSGNKNATLSNNGLTLTKTGGGRTGWDCNVLGSAGWVSGVHEFSVRLDTTCEMMVGVAPAQTNSTGPNWSTCGFYLGTHSGALFAQDGTWKRDYLGRRCSKKGTVIRVKLDCDRHCLWFGVDAEDFPSDPAFRDLPTLPLHASFDVDSK